MVYSSVDEVYARPVLEAFTSQTGIPIKLVSDSEETKSTGLLNRLLAERARPPTAVNVRHIVATLVLFATPPAKASEGAPVAANAGSPARSLATRLSSPHLDNFFRAATNVFSGGSPDGNGAFAEIANLGVKAIISVDGSKPDVEGARKHGLRYIHLPIGYDGAPANRVAELVRAAQSSQAPLYIHCHHGKHRGPAAVAVVCQATAGWTTNQAVAWLKDAGTAADYPGLYRSAIEFRMPKAEVLAGIVELPEAVETSALTDTMVAMDEEFDRLKSAQKSDWKSIPGHPDIIPAQSATILWEHFRELMRTEDTAKRTQDFCAKLAIAEKAADDFRLLLRDPAGGAADRRSAFQVLGESCVDCHKASRN